MSPKRRELEDKSRLAPAQNQQLVDQAVETLTIINQRREFEKLFESAAKLTPVPLHHALRCYLQAPLLYDASASLMTTVLTTTSKESLLDVLHDTLDPLSLRDTYFFLDKLLKEGLIVAVMSNVADDYCEESQKGRGVQCRVPDRSIIWPVIRYILENPGDCGHWCWLETALLSAEDHFTDREEAVRLLVEYIRDDSAAARSVREMCPNALAILARLDVIQSRDDDSREVRSLAEFVRKAPALAALSLSNLDSNTPGLADMLICALSYYWDVSGKLLFCGRTGRGMAAEALSKLGSQGKKALPWLREIILSEWDNSYWSVFCSDRQMAFDAYVILCENASAFCSLLDEIEKNARVNRRLENDYEDLARETRASFNTYVCEVRDRISTASPSMGRDH